MTTSPVIESLSTEPGTTGPVAPGSGATGTTTPDVPAAFSDRHIGPRSDEIARMLATVASTAWKPSTTPFSLL